MPAETKKGDSIVDGHSDVSLHGQYILFIFIWDKKSLSENLVFNLIHLSEDPAEQHWSRWP